MILETGEDVPVESFRNLEKVWERIPELRLIAAFLCYDGFHARLANGAPSARKIRYLRTSANCMSPRIS